MDINVTIIAVTKSDAMSKTGKAYVAAEVTYKNNSFQGKVESFKINSYSNVWKQVVEMQQGQSFTISREKENGFNVWTKIVPSTASPGTAPVATATPEVRVAKSTYETAEERARKQVYIVKQSSISAAIELLSVGAKVPPSTDLVLKHAQEFVDFVFEDNKPAKLSLIDMPNDEVGVE